jgi:hypothetical protein
MLSTPDFIFTIGAPRCILECIAKNTHFNHIEPSDIAQRTTNKLTKSDQPTEWFGSWKGYLGLETGYA